MPARKKKSQPPDEDASGKASSKLYTLVVYLIGGSAGGEFEGQTISRTIQIRGDQTLEDLHRAIFKAFTRFDEHLYEFMLNVGPSDKIATKTVAFEEEMRRCPNHHHRFTGPGGGSGIDVFRGQLGAPDKSHSH